MVNAVRWFGGLVCVGLMPGSARAEPVIPPVQAFDVEYHVTGADGVRVREMTVLDRQQFINKARCACGQQIGVDISLPPSIAYDFPKLVQTLVGQMCAYNESHVLEGFRRCAQLASQVLTPYPIGIETAFHPVWLTGGVDGQLSSHRDPDDAYSVGSCAGGRGEAGLWMCAQTNALAGCQEDEFFLDGRPVLTYDFDPPIAQPTDVSVEAFDEGAIVHWDIEAPGDIAGFRVLCEEVGAEGPPAPRFAAPDVTAVPDGRSYFTANNVCGDQPFSTVMLSGRPAVPAACGNGVVDAGEACDDGADNADDGMCTSGCTLAVGRGLHDLDWAHVCSEHAAFDEDSVAVAGLANGKTYNLVLVTHDAFGNPRAYKRMVQVTPSGDLPALPGSDEGCGCNETAPGGGLLALAGLLLRARRRRVCGR